MTWFNNESLFFNGKLVSKMCHLFPVSGYSNFHLKHVNVNKGMSGTETIISTL